MPSPTYKLPSSSNRLSARKLAASAFAVGAARVGARCLAAAPALAVVELNITQGKIQALPIAIPDFVGDGSVDPATAREVSDVVASDLRTSGLFAPIDQAAFIEKARHAGQPCRLSTIGGC